MKTKHLVGIFAVLTVASLAILSLGQTNAATTTQTTLKIKTGNLLFYKDTGTAMNTYFGSTSPNASAAIDLGSYTGDLNPISAASAGDHRFTLDDQEGKAFTVTLISSDLTAPGASIASGAITYTGTTRNGIGKELTATGTFNASLDSSRTFVGRTTKGLSKFAQQITLLVAIPAAQAPEDYTGLLTFTISQP